MWKSYGFIGFLHTADFKNFILIYKSKFLKSRNQLIKEGINFIDNAEEGVIEKTSETINGDDLYEVITFCATNFKMCYMQNVTRKNIKLNKVEYHVIHLPT